MGGRRGRATVRLIVAMTATLVGTACGTGTIVGGDGSDTSSDHVLTEPVYFSSEGVFAPPEKGTTPKLDAQEAYSAFAGRDRDIPDRVDYELGLVTFAPSVTDVLVWGYHLRTAGYCMFSGGIPDGPTTSTPTATPTPRMCVEWDFISATTGKHVIGTSQIVSGPGSDIPSPTPPPGSAELADGGAMEPNMERFSPDALVVQAPLSTIRWTFDMANCRIELHWFLPRGDAASEPGTAPCRLAGVFSVDTAAGFTSRGHVFAVVAGHIAGQVDDRRYLVRVVLANGETMGFDPDEGNRAWLFPVQRCGDFAGTRPVAVEAVKSFDGPAFDRLPVPSGVFDRQSAADCTG